MRSDSISDKSHVGMELCFFCNEPKGILLDRRLRKSLPRQAVYNQEPCDECKKLMERGIILISVRDGESGDNPYRTGGWVVVTEEGIRQAFTKDKAEALIKSRVAFVPDKVWNAIGLNEEGSCPT